MMINDVIVLDDNKKYLLLDKTDYENYPYYYAVLLDDQEKPTEKYSFVKEITENNETFVEEVTDNAIRSSLLVIFMNNLGLDIDNMQ